MDSTDMKSLLTEQQNLYRLQELVDFHVKRAAASGSFSLTEPLIKALHGVAMNQLLQNAGEYRQGNVHIRNAAHVPPEWFEVPGHMVNLCAYINGAWQNRDLIHLAAFTMWRLNFVHPFTNGNGRVSRAISYLVMSAKHGKQLPAENSVVRQIIDNRQPYYNALAAADDLCARGAPHDQCVGELENLLTYLLREQLRASLGSLIRS